MQGVNGYFQLVEKNKKAYLKIFPAQSGGKALDIKEVLAYIEDLGYQGFDLRELNRVVTQSEQREEVLLGSWNGFHEQEKMKLNISSDDMLVYARFYSPSNAGMVMDEREILRDLEARNIKVGIQEENIRNFIEKREYCKDILIAKGIPPVQGKDAKIKYFFNTNLNLKPKRNEDGTVDYHQLNTINHVEKGQCLARIEKEVPGSNGKNVFGKDVPPRPVKSQKFSYSNNIALSEDGTEIYSMVTGHVNLVKDKVFVADVYEVPADVDNTTGDITYDGNVHVKGNVKSGFVIDTKGDIIVEGVVEGAELYAGGQIIVKRGIHGMTKGVLQAQGNIITKFIESANVVSNGYIETESILHSTVSARTEIRVGGKKGFITGGIVRAGNLVEANNIGSEMGGNTRIEVGVEPKIKERYIDLQKEIQQINKELEQIRPILKSFAEKMAKQEKIPAEKQNQVQLIAQSFREKQQVLQSKQTEYQEVRECMSLGTNARIRVHGTIYQGVWVGISDIGIFVKDNYSHSQVYKDKGDVVIRPL